MLVLVANLEQREDSLIRLEFAADEIECKHQAESRRLEVAADEIACKHKAGAGNDLRKTKGEGAEVT